MFGTLFVTSGTFSTFGTFGTFLDPRNNVPGQNNCNETTKNTSEATACSWNVLQPLPTEKKGAWSQGREDNLQGLYTKGVETPTWLTEEPSRPYRIRDRFWNDLLPNFQIGASCPTRRPSAVGRPAGLPLAALGIGVKKWSKSEPKTEQKKTISRVQ